jgi:hypothetical protein
MSNWANYYWAIAFIAVASHGSTTEPSVGILEPFHTMELTALQIILVISLRTAFPAVVRAILQSKICQCMPL